nr:prolyl oligopeptidase family serine peptidase [uncultured Undibacterium sp.]
MAVLNNAKVQAGAYVSGCYDPSVDSWYNTTIGNKADTKKLSPLLMLDANAPPQIFFHTKNDEMRAYQGASEMARKLQALNIQHELVSFDQGGHFFVFSSPEERERIKKHLAGFVQNLRWTN